MSEVLNGLEDSEIKGGDFIARENSKMLGDSQNLGIHRGFFLAEMSEKERDYEGMKTSFNSLFWLTTNPHSFSDKRPQMLDGLKESKINGGKFNSRAGGNVLNNSRNLVISGGIFTAESWAEEGPESEKDTEKPTGQGMYHCVVCSTPSHSSQFRSRFWVDKAV